MTLATINLTNYTYDELSIGQSDSITRTATEADVQAFAMITHDYNSVHLDDEYAESTPFKRRIVHGMWAAGLISSVLGTRFPGMGVIYVSQSLKFTRPVYIDDTVTVTLTVKEKDDAKKRVILDCEVVNQDGKVVVRGVSEVIAPTEKAERAVIKLDDLTLGQRFHH